MAIFRKIEQLSLTWGPSMLTLLLIVLGMVPKHVAGIGNFMPLAVLTGVYYWTLFQPDLLPFWMAFFLGLVEDSLYGTPLGGTSLMLVLFRLLVVSQRRVFADEAFWGIWLGFAVLSLPFFLLLWLLVSLVGGRMIPIEAGMLQWLLTASGYPLFHALFNRMYAHLPKGLPRPPP